MPSAGIVEFHGPETVAMSAAMTNSEAAKRSHPEVLASPRGLWEARPDRAESPSPNVLVKARS